MTSRCVGVVGVILNLPPSVRLYVATEPVDMRRSFDGLSALVEHHLEQDPLLCVEPEYAAASHKHVAKLLTAWAFACGRRHIWSKGSQADSAPDPWVKAVRHLASDARFVQAATHHLDIRCRVTMSGGDLRMSEPCLDRQKVHARLQQDHRERVPEDVRRYPLSRELGHLFGCCSDGPPHDMNSAEARQALSVGADEHRHVLMLAYTSLAQQVVDCC